jgi:hypothetical protein
MPAVTEITITIPPELSKTTDEYLAVLWNVAQYQPESHNDKEAGLLVERLTQEIVSRWLSKAPRPRARFGSKGYYWEQLCRFAKYIPGPREDFNAGEWVVREQLANVDDQTPAKETEQ